METFHAGRDVWGYAVNESKRAAKLREVKRNE